VKPLLPWPMFALATLLALNACSQQSSSDANTQSPAPAAAPATSTAPQSIPSAVGAEVTFTDISGDFGEAAIRDEAALGILDSTSGQFKPGAPISRAQFVRWLVKANNVYQKDHPEKQIRLAHNGQQFTDVPPKNPDFPYIQGLANAGYVIGIDKKHFAPNRPITREELIAIKAPVDEGGDIKGDVGMAEFDLKNFSDVKKINKHYVAAIDEDGSVRTTQNAARIWGTLRAFSPKKPVTRSEAAIAIGEVNNGSAAVTLGRTAPPPPS